jgi:Mrp family chromosome partitioning ATPase
MSDQVKKTTIPLLTNYTPHSLFAEAYRTLRANIQFSVMDKKFKTLLVTSASAGEGKTSTVANLAYTIAQTGKSVLMVDADMRRPTLSKNIVDTESPGITGLLANFFGTMDNEGDLSRVSINDLARLLSFQKKTGLLTLTADREIVEVFFLNGSMADIYWRSRPPEKELLNVLVMEELLSSEQASLIKSRQQDTGQRLEYIIANMRLIENEVLEGALNIYIIEALQVLYGMHQGSFQFKESSDAGLQLNINDLVDFPALLKQASPGREELPYLQSKVDEVVKPVADNLSLLPSGPLPPNPSEILSSTRMAFLLKHLQKMFDVIIIDSPPILPASDALLISPHTDGVLLVVKEGLLNREIVKKAVEQLHLAQANILGVVLNDVDVKKQGYSSYYHKYYSEYYGEKPDE